ncbi:DUF4031 domain-containing protein [Jatrophihabitans sp. DSM 45814]
MTCYVDTVRSYPDAGLRYTEFCHLLADHRAELHSMAEALGMPRRFFQDHPWRWHYDLPGHLRPEAIRLGAVTVQIQFVGALLKSRRAESGVVLSEVSNDC